MGPGGMSPMGSFDDKVSLWGNKNGESEKGERESSRMRESPPLHTRESLFIGMWHNHLSEIAVPLLDTLEILLRLSE